MNHNNKHIRLINSDLDYTISEINDLLDIIENEVNEQKNIIIGALLGKVNITANSIRTLLNHNAQSDSKSLLRNLLEASLKLLCIVKDEDYYDLFIKNTYSIRFEYCNHIMQYKNIVGIETYQEADRIKSTFSKDEIRNNNRLFSKYTNKKLAEITGLKELYVLSYKIFCSDVHTDLISVRNHIIVGSIEKDNKMILEAKGVYLETLLTILIKVLLDIRKYYGLSIVSYKLKYKTNSKWVCKIINSI